MSSMHSFFYSLFIHQLIHSEHFIPILWISPFFFHNKLFIHSLSSIISSTALPNLCTCVPSTCYNHKLVIFSVHYHIVNPQPSATTGQIAAKMTAIVPLFFLQGLTSELHRKVTFDQTELKQVASHAAFDQHCQNLRQDCITPSWTKWPHVTSDQHLCPKHHKSKGSSVTSTSMAECLELECWSQALVELCKWVVPGQGSPIDFAM